MQKTAIRKALRKTEATGAHLLMRLATVIVILLLTCIIVTILRHGLPALTWEMISQTPKGGFYFGQEGGILNAIIGSLYLAVGSTVLAFVTGYPVALYLNTTMRSHKKATQTFRFVLDILWGIPSIVYGAFGFTVMVVLHQRASLLAGIVVVTLFVLPIMIRAIDEGLQHCPVGLQEASLSLGMTNTAFAFRIMTKQCFPAIVTGVLLSFGRAIGDAASVLFTAGFTDFIPRSLGEPTATLPLAIFFQLTSPIEEVQQRAYASAAVLTIIILIISIMTRTGSRRFNGKTIHE